MAFAAQQVIQAEPASRVGVVLVVTLNGDNSMVSRFKDSASLASRAVQIWQVLVGMAHTRRTTTYKELAVILGYKGAGTLGRQLGHIMFFCDQNHLPPLTVLVVNSETGLPGEGLEVRGDLHAQREETFNYKWFELVPPTVKQYEQAWSKAEAADFRLEG